MLALLNPQLDAFRYAGHDFDVVATESQLLGHQTGDGATQDGLGAQGGVLLPQCQGPATHHRVFTDIWRHRFSLGGSIATTRRRRSTNTTRNHGGSIGVIIFNCYFSSNARSCFDTFWKTSSNCFSVLQPRLTFISSNNSTPCCRGFTQRGRQGVPPHYREDNQLRVWAATWRWGKDGNDGGNNRQQSDQAAARDDLRTPAGCNPITADADSDR